MICYQLLEYIKIYKYNYLSYNRFGWLFTFYV